MDTNSHTMEGGYLEGNSHANGGIKIKTPEGQIEAEGGETIINKRSMESQDILICEGTPKEIASKVNEYGGGVEFAEGGNCKTVSMAEDGTQVESNMLKEETTTFDNGGAVQQEISTKPETKQAKETKETTYTITSLYDSELSWQSSYKDIEDYIKEEGGQFDCQKDDTMAVCLRKLGLTMVANIEIPIYETDFDIHDDQTASRGTNLRSTDKDKRPSPSISATIFPVGHIMEGNDGNMWQINEDSRGIHRWGRVKAEDGVVITKSDEDIRKDKLLELLEKLKTEGKLKRYYDVRGNGKKLFETIIPNKSEKGMYKRYESTSQSSLGTLQNEYLDENDVLNWLKKTSPKYGLGVAGKYFYDKNKDEIGKNKKFNNGGGVGEANADSVLLEKFESINNFEEKWLWYLKNDNLVVEFTLHYEWVDEEYYVGPEVRMGEVLKVQEYRYVALEDEDSIVVMVSKEKEKEIIKELDNLYKEYFENKDKDTEIDNVIYGERKYIYDGPIIGYLGQSFVAKKEGIIEVYSGSDARSAEVKVGDTFLVTKVMEDETNYLGKLKINGWFKLNANLSGKDLSKMNYENQDEVLYLLRKENIDGNSNLFAQFKNLPEYEKGNTIKGAMPVFKGYSKYQVEGGNMDLSLKDTIAMYSWIDNFFEIYSGNDNFSQSLDIYNEFSKKFGKNKEQTHDIIDSGWARSRGYYEKSQAIKKNANKYEKGNIIKDEMTFNNSISNAIIRLTNYIGTHENKIVINNSTYTIEKVMPNFIRVSGGQGATYNIVPYFPKNALNTPSPLLTPRSYYSLSRGSVKHTFAIFEDGKLIDIAEEGIDVNINNIQKNKFEIVNNYEGKTPAEIWSLWTDRQRIHFLKDHKMQNFDYSLNYNNYTFDELPLSIKTAVRFHKNSGQYVNGGIIGKRIKMIKMNNEPYPVEPGTMGTVKFIDDSGQIHVNWDNGRTLAIIPRIDEYQIM